MLVLLSKMSALFENLVLSCPTNTRSLLPRFYNNKGIYCKDEIRKYILPIIKPELNTAELKVCFSNATVSSMRDSDLLIAVN